MFTSAALVTVVRQNTEILIKIYFFLYFITYNISDISDRDLQSILKTVLLFFTEKYKAVAMSNPENVELLMSLQAALSRFQVQFCSWHQWVVFLLIIWSVQKLRRTI